jgi:hypothetical protein
MIASDPGPGATNSPRRWIAFGAGTAFLGLRATQPELPFSSLVDDTPGYAGLRLDGLPISSSAALAQQPLDETFVVVCANTSAAVGAISRQLVDAGRLRGRGFCDSSDFQVPAMAARVRETFGVELDPGRLPEIRSLALNLRPRNLSTIAGSWLFSQLAGALGVEGAVAECGVYQGANALISLLSCPALRTRRYLLLDSFAGLKPAGGTDPAQRAGEFADVSQAVVQDQFTGFPGVQLVPGFFSNTLPHLAENAFALVYIDCDLEIPAEECLAHFWPRLAPGGYLLVHDYWYPEIPLPAGAPAPFTGIRTAIHRFFAAELPAHVVFPETSHILLRKPA